MLRMLLLGPIVVWIGAAQPAAAERPEVPASAVTECERLLGAQAVRYVLRQIDLTEAQASHAEGLIEAMFSGDDPSLAVDIDEVRELWRKLDRAKLTDQHEKVKDYTERLRQMGQDLTGYAEFYANLEPELTEKQKERLAWARRRLERDPSGAVRPGDLILLARDLDLTEGQRKKLIGVAEATSKLLGPRLRLKPKLELEVTNHCANLIRRMLTPQQLSEFEYRVCTIRPDLIDTGLRVTTPPQSQPSVAGEPKPAEE